MSLELPWYFALLMCRTFFLSCKPCCSLADHHKVSRMVQPRSGRSAGRRDLGCTRGTRVTPIRCTRASWQGVHVLAAAPSP